MGTFLFKWDHPASEVWVTGTFDDWGKTVKLDQRDGNLHEKLVELPNTDSKIYYKFVVDGNWITDHAAPQEIDHDNNTNNVLLPENITKKSSATQPIISTMSGVTPQSTTANLAGNVPKESEKGIERSGSSDLPGAFPETPAGDISEFAANPIPASSGIGNPVNVPAGEKLPQPSTFTSNTIASTARDDPELVKKEKEPQAFGISPLPATSGVGNPIQTKPGEDIPKPHEFTGNTVNSHVTTDKESYRNASAAPQLPDVVTPQQERDASGVGMFGLPEKSANMIPESSLPMGGVSSMEKDPGIMTQSAAPQSTTAQLAGKVPLEARGVPEVPDIVKESQKEAGFAPEASANPEMVKEKSDLEKELESKLPAEPATSEGVSNGAAKEDKKFSNGEIAGLAAGGVGAGAAIGAGIAHATKDSTSLPSRGLPESVQKSIDEMNKGTPIASTVPETVQESITKAHQSPEAAASKEMVHEKADMEAQLLKTVKTEDSSGEHAPALGATGPTPIAATVPETVQESITKAHQSPEAAASKEMVHEKADMEAQLLKTVKNEDGSGEPAPTTSAALASTAPVPMMKSTETPIGNGASKSGPGLAAPATAPAMTEAAKPVVDSRDVSPMTRGPGSATQGPPGVTTGVASSSTPATSTAAPITPSKAATPSNATPSSAKTAESSTSASASASTERKRSHRASGFFGKLKSKFSHKDDK